MKVISDWCAACQIIKGNMVIIGKNNGIGKRKLANSFFIPPIDLPMAMQDVGNLLLSKIVVDTQVPDAVVEQRLFHVTILIWFGVTVTMLSYSISGKF